MLTVLTVAQRWKVYCSSFKINKIAFFEKILYNIYIKTKKRKAMSEQIISFTSRSQYKCFSNFAETAVTYNGITYQSSEAAWQSLKTLDKEKRIKFSKMTPSTAKRYGRQVSLRPDWEEVKYDLMVDVLRAKFTQNSLFKQKLLSTGNAYLEENTSCWHDNIWGNCHCLRCKDIPGKNLLGKALMQVRSELKEEV